MTQWPVFPFPSSEAFGTRMRDLRVQYGNLPMRVIQDAKGPSTSTQGRIENGEGEVTEETMTKYATAYANLHRVNIDPAQSRDMREWSLHRHTVDPGFIKALGEAGAAVAAEEATVTRRHRIEAEVRRTGLNAVVFGADIRSPHIISGSVLRMTREGERQDLCGTAPDADAALFAQLATTIASRHRTVSITHRNGDGKTPAALWPWQSQVHKDAHSRIDPLDRVQSLGEARRRAIALQVPAPDIEAVASTIFLIVALTAELNAVAATQAGEDHYVLTPLETWRQYVNTGRWDTLKATLPEPVAGAMPTTQTMIEATTRALEPWVDARTVPSFEVMFSVTEDRILNWHETPMTPETALTPEPFDLWVVAPKLFGAAKGLLTDKHIFGVAISHDEVGSIDPTPEQPVYQWCPSGVDDNISLLYEPQFGWRAVQIA